MKRTQDTVSRAVDRLFPNAQPEPARGCMECLAISVKRANARSVGDFSGASDANVVLRTHLREEHGAE